MYDLKVLMKATDKAIGMARDAKHTFINAPVNWRTLYCQDAQFCIHANGDESHVVIIEEADPDNHEFQSFISEELAHMGFPDVEVRTEW